MPVGAEHDAVLAREREQPAARRRPGARGRRRRRRRRRADLDLATRSARPRSTPTAPGRRRPRRAESSKRGTELAASRGRRARTPPRCPTVKSVRALEGLARDGEVDHAAPGLGEVEVERVEQVDSRAGRVDRHLRRHLQQRLGVVEDDLDAGVDELVGQLLRGGRRDGEDADDDVLLLDDLLEVVDVADARRR